MYIILTRNRRKNITFVTFFTCFQIIHISYVNYNELMMYAVLIINFILHNYETHRLTKVFVRFIYNTGTKNKTLNGLRYRTCSNILSVLSMLS